MSRRIEVELTSARPDGTWTWRAAGAREPKGVVEGSILPSTAKVGDVLRVDADMDVDGISILAVLPPKGARKEPDRLEIIGAEQTFEPVTSTLVDKRDRPRRDRSDRPPRRDGEGGDRRERRDRPPKRDGDPATADRAPRAPRQQRDPKERRERPPRPPVPMLPERPKPKRLKPGRTHRKAILDSLPDEQRAVAEQVLKGGVPAVREALKEQNEKLKAEGQPPIKSEGVVSLAEDLLPRVRVAEWLDRAEAALADLDELDLRDLRSVVAASGDSVVARDESTRELAEKLRDGLSVRQDKEHQEWLADIDAALGVGRVVRALRLSSRPPKAGVRFPTELGTRLAEAAGAALAGDAAPDRWGAVLEAVAYSPVRASVTPAGYPATVTDELTALVKPLAGQVPEIAKHLGIEPPPPGARASRQVRRPAGPRKPKPPPPPPPPTTAKGAKPPAETKAPVDTEAATQEAALSEAPVTDEQPKDAAPTETAPEMTEGVETTAPTTEAPAETSTDDATRSQPAAEPPAAEAPADHATTSEAAAEPPAAEAPADHATTSQPAAEPPAAEPPISEPETPEAPTAELPTAEVPPAEPATAEAPDDRSATEALAGDEPAADDTSA